MTKTTAGERKTMLSAIQPSGHPHLGNYLGAVRRWVEMQEHYRCFFFAVDMHVLTGNHDPKTLAPDTYDVLAFYIASGIDPEKTTLFIQSHVSEHAELAWVLTCSAYMGELNRMTQFKDKSSRQDKNINAGLFTYPVLQAADILLYNTDIVPVGEDQKQHLELSRNLAGRFNTRFEKEVFKVPEPHIGSEGARIMDLQDPTSKMSKSTPSPKGCLYIADSDKEIAKKLKSAVTDSGEEIVYSDEKPGVKNLININALVSGRSPERICSDLKGKMYGHLKVDTADAVVAAIAPIRERMFELRKDTDYLDGILEAGAAKAREVARATLKRVYDAVGFLPRR